MNRAIDTGTSEHALVRRVDNGVNLQRDDVPLEYLESRHSSGSGSGFAREQFPHARHHFTGVQLDASHHLVV